MQKADHKSSTANPAKSFAIVLIITLVILLTLAVEWWFSNQTFQTEQIQNLRIKELSGTIQHLDEVLTMSTRMAVVTGDPDWEKRYREFEPQLDSAIKEILALTLNPSLEKALHNTDNANQKLVSLENKAFAFVNEENLKEARDLIFGEEYELQKKIYAEGLQQFQQSLQKHLESKRQGRNHRIIVEGLVCVLTILLLSAFWLPVRRLILNHIQQIEENETELKKSYEELERRVENRTKELRESEMQSRQIVESAHDAFISIDENSLIKIWNSKAEKLFGYSRGEVLGKSLADLIIPPKYRKAHQDAIERFKKTRKGNILNQQIEITAINRAGKEFLVELVVWAVSSEKSHVFNAFVRDISEQRQLELELRQAQKLESIGQLAAGIAHEINTPIQFVGDNTRFLNDAFQDFRNALKKYQDIIKDTPQSKTLGPRHLSQLQQIEKDFDFEFLNEEIPKAVQQSLEGVDRVSSIVRAMKEFAHPQEKERTAVDINHNLENTLIVARNELKYVANVETAFGKLPPVICEAGELNQVFLNILVNAAHAITDVVKDSGTMGTISVKTAFEGDWVVIAISDTGGGIPEEIRAKIFDPFFTTKEVGKGTGQGLSIARRVVQKHGGSLTFATKIGQGTTFFIRLPLDPNVARSKEKVS